MPTFSPVFSVFKLKICFFIVGIESVKMALGVPLLQVFLSEFEQLKAVKMNKIAANTEGVFFKNIFGRKDIKSGFEKL